MSVKAQKDPEKLSYEEAMSELESLVGRMEQGGLTLEESVESYARGIALTNLPDLPYIPNTPEPSN